MRRLIQTALIGCFGLFAGSTLVMAQTPQANVYVGLGTATDSSNGQALDIFGTGNFINTPKLTGLFATVGGGLMITNHFGAGAEINWRAGQGNYSGVNYRPIFYDFNGIWQPIKTKRFVPEIQAGIGGVAVNFNANTTECSLLVGCSNVNLGSESSSHFQAHFAVAARIYATPHIFVRPAFDAHWVNDFFQFGSNWVPEYTLGVGYSFGGE
ncbi:MAG TPA: outer membrane beta-barrel protein [Bryobacteraceae bacterium]|jgi:hypothetical protein|nr:outer membrane beta-barrel protein [Bryobacteraceae bacterium]